MSLLQTILFCVVFGTLALCVVAIYFIQAKVKWLDRQWKGWLTAQREVFVKTMTNAVMGKINEEVAKRAKEVRNAD